MPPLTRNYQPLPYAPQPRYVPNYGTLGELMGIRARNSQQGWAQLAHAFNTFVENRNQAEVAKAALAQREQARQDDLKLKRDEMSERKAEREETRRIRHEADTRQKRMDAEKYGTEVAEAIGYGPMEESQIDPIMQSPQAGRVRYAFGPGTAEGPELMPTAAQKRQIALDAHAKAVADRAASDRAKDDTRADRSLEATLSHQKAMEQIARQNAATAAANAQARLGGGAGTLTPGYRNALERVIGNIPANRRGPKIAHAERLLSEQNETELKDFIRLNAIESEGMETRNQITGRQATIASLKDTTAIMRELKAKGVNTGLFKGTVEDMYRALGKTSDPELVALRNRLAGTLINYRKAATGAAFGEREGAAYEKMFPNYKNDLPVNEALINGLMREMETYDRTYWEHKLGPEGSALILGGLGESVSPPSAKPKVTRDANGNLVAAPRPR